MVENHSSDVSSFPLVLILLGPPGSGKGTQATRLVQDYHIPHVSTGDLFRAHMAAETDLGKKVKYFMQSGQLVPDELVFDMLFNRIEQPDCYGGYLLDGFPRTLKQAERFALYPHSRTTPMVLYLDVADEEIIKRASNRVICRHCGVIYNLILSPPQHEGVCDQCGGKVYRRPDDDPAVVCQRLKVYHQQTEPLVEYYTHKGLLHRFDGNQSPDFVYDEIKLYIDRHRWSG